MSTQMTNTNYVTYVNFAEPKMAKGKNYSSDTNWCVQCGKKCGANPWFVEIVDGNEIRVQDGTEAEYNGSYMGCWAVGNECAKSFAPNVLFKGLRTFEAK